MFENVSNRDLQNGLLCENLLGKHGRELGLHDLIFSKVLLHYLLNLLMLNKISDCHNKVVDLSENSLF